MTALLTTKEALAAALRKCRVGDGAPVSLFSDGDVAHIVWALTSSGAVIDAATMTDDLRKRFDHSWNCSWHDVEEIEGVTLNGECDCWQAALVAALSERTS